MLFTTPVVYIYLDQLSDWISSWLTSLRPDLFQRLRFETLPGEKLLRDGEPNAAEIARDTSPRARNGGAGEYIRFCEHG